MTTTITIGNYKGGVGKTTTSTIFSYLLAKKHFKTLLIDFDPQANSTEIIQKTFKPFDYVAPVSFADGIRKDDLSHTICKVNNYLDLLPSNWNLSLFPEILDHYHKKTRPLLLRHWLNDKNIYDNYDFILIDTPPTLSQFTNNAILASDYVVMVLQTQQLCYMDSLKFVQYLKGLYKDSKASFNLLGIIPYLIKKNGTTDKDIMRDSKKSFGRAMLHADIYQRERVKRFARYGITDKDMWDTRTLRMYKSVLDELLSRIKLLEED